MAKMKHNFSGLGYFFLILILSFSVNLYAQHKIPSGFCMSQNEKALADAINKIRVDHGKKPLNLSVSLTFVAKTHVKDLMINHPDTSICNLSSWSNKGKWIPCCYNAYVVNHKCMWDKPRELTSYPYRGYELAAYMQGGIEVDSLAHLWEETEESLDMILTQGIWEKKSWECMGVGIYGEYASVWFGQGKDRAGKPKLCVQKQAQAKRKAELRNEHIRTSYYIISGSFSDLKGAKEALKRFKKNGFKNAGIIVNEKRVRVYLNRFENLKAAKKAKKNLPYSFRKVWILQR